MSEKKIKAGATKYNIATLKSNSKELVGYPEEVAEGALFESKQKEMTVDEFRKAVEAFLAKEVK